MGTLTVSATFKRK